MDYNIAIKRLHMYYDMKLVTLGIIEERNLKVPISNFHTTIHSTTTYIISN